MAMHRDMSLILAILRYTEEKGTPGKPLSQPRFVENNPAQVLYHMQLCAEAGFIEMRGANTIIRLTWKGHEFLEEKSDW